MKVEIAEALLMSVWKDSFKDKQTKEEVEYYRALITVTGEKPMQLKVSEDDYELLRAAQGTTGIAVVELDCEAGRRQQVYLKEWK